jgi:sugar lactone lactonase YvrE
MATGIAVPVLVPTLVPNNLRQHLGEGPIWHAGREELLYLDILNAKVIDTYKN